MKKLSLFLFALLFVSLSFAQSFNVPKTYEFKTDADYDKYENQILECVDWLIATPINQNIRKRESAISFLAAYSVKNERVNPYLNKIDFPFLLNGDLGVIYVASWTKSCLTQNYVNNKAEFTLRATNQVVDYYNSNKKKFKKAKGIKIFAEEKQKGTLDSFVKSKL